MASLILQNGEAEEDSFVILGSSPLSSLSSNMESLGNRIASLNIDNNLKSLAEDGSISMKSNMKNSSEQANMISSNISVKTVTNEENISLVPVDASLLDAVDASLLNVSTVKEGTDQISMSTSQKSVATPSINSDLPRTNGLAQPSTLAASFILGEIDADALKNSIYSQFPSMCSMSNSGQDVAKLQGFFNMYSEMKNALVKVNQSMKVIYDKWNNEHEERLNKEETYEKQLKSLHTQIAELRNENINLRREIEAKVEQLKINMEHHEKDRTTLIQEMSEKDARMMNMTSQIEKLEQQQLATFEYVPKNEQDTKEKPDYVDRKEHERIVKQFEHQLSDLLAQNLDLKDVQTQYINEMTCLKVNCTAAEELVKQFRSDIALLKSKDIEKSDIFKKYENERRIMRDEVSVLRHQMEIYARDWEIERSARENLAGEKDQLLQDLRSIQRKNQELIEQTQQRLDQSSTGNIRADVARESYIGNDQRPVRALPSTSNAEPTVHNYCCPLCYKSFEKLDTLEQHVNSCLKDA